MEFGEKIRSFDNEMSLEEKSAELLKIYEMAEKEGLRLREFKANRGFWAVAGSEKLDEKIGRERADWRTMPMHECIERGILSRGGTREKACENAVADFKKHFGSALNK